MLIAGGKAAWALSALAAALTMGRLQIMSLNKVKVALAVLLTVSALGVGVGVSQHAGRGGEHLGAVRAFTAGARQANGREPPGRTAPAFERFYAGGFRSLRGFRFRGVWPNVNGFEMGGDFMFLNSIEYQVPVKANDQLFLVAFVDSGTVERDVEIKDYRVSAGGGRRLTVPMLGPVPIALDFGFPVVKGVEAPEQLFSFWMGFFS
jgi:outer membrane protein assembly factor BamA